VLLSLTEPELLRSRWGFDVSDSGLTKESEEIADEGDGRLGAESGELSVTRCWLEVSAQRFGTATERGYSEISL
jgi:hypothetical protein